VIVFPCKNCQSPLSAEEQYAGQIVRCPTCAQTQPVPGGATAVKPELVAAGTVDRPPALPPRAPAVPSPFIGRMPLRGSAMGRPFGFNCGYCSSRLQAYEGMGAQEGQCPTCGNTITIPIRDRYGRLIDPKTREIIKQDPHPVHAYAAAGARAPKILRQEDGSQAIQCPHCRALCPISANSCKSCRMPFTMEGVTTADISADSNSLCVSALVVGIIGLPGFCTVVLPILAVVLGILGLKQANKAGAESRGRGMAIAGIICGVIGGIFSAIWIVSHL
jgi:DNA-directed RNA polymerase subunit M/transcription elongation factor TFIIS